MRAALQRSTQDKRHLAGCRGERAVCRELSRLALDGILHLDDRRRRADPDERANLDHLVIGPQGVFVVDAKNWAGQITVRRQHLLQDGEPVDHRLIALALCVTSRSGSRRCSERPASAYGRTRSSASPGP